MYYQKLLLNWDGTLTMRDVGLYKVPRLDISANSWDFSWHSSTHSVSFRTLVTTFYIRALSELS